MRELSDLQKDMLKAWIVAAEKYDLNPKQIPVLDERLSALINSIEYEKPLSYFPRLLK